MNTLEAIAARRSIRRFTDEPVSEQDLRTILEAAVQAPSGKNDQPWRFVVVQGEQRAEMVRLMRQGISRWEAEGRGAGSAPGTARIMEQAPVTVFVFNESGTHPWLPHDFGHNIANLVSLQSIGAAIQNMLLAAQDLGLGSLWICDIIYAYEELSKWLGEDHQLVAAVSFGHPAESPAARPRKRVEEVTRWV